MWATNSVHYPSYKIFPQQKRNSKQQEANRPKENYCRTRWTNTVHVQSRVVHKARQLLVTARSRLSRWPYITFWSRLSVHSSLSHVPHESLITLRPRQPLKSWWSWWSYGHTTNKNNNTHIHWLPRSCIPLMLVTNYKEACTQLVMPVILVWLPNKSTLDEIVYLSSRKHAEMWPVFMFQLIFTVHRPYFRCTLWPFCPLSPSSSAIHMDATIDIEAHNPTLQSRGDLVPPPPPPPPDSVVLVVLCIWP